MIKKGKVNDDVNVIYFFLLFAVFFFVVFFLLLPGINYTSVAREFR